jgi:putative aldouronate transport system substrate-binding protein
MKRLVCGIIASCILTIPLFSGGRGQQRNAPGAPVKLRYYEALSRAAQGNKSFATHMGFIELQKRTGVELEFISPPVGNETEAFNLMVASRDFPDIITVDWLNAPGGAGAYLDDVIISLNDPIDKWAPDLKRVFDRFPITRKEATLDDGSLYCFPNLYVDDLVLYSWGPVVRGDLMKKIPEIDISQFPGNMETLEEWEKILLAVKNSGLKSDSGHDIIPFTFTFNDPYGFIVGAWGIGHRFTQENGRPVYGPSDPRYREYVQLLKRWYDLGILDKEFAANTARLVDEKVLDNRVFAFPHSMGNGVTRYTGMARQTNPDFTLNMVKYPVLKKGDKIQFEGRNFNFVGYGAAISTACKNVEAATKFLNYEFSDDGFILENYGIEGQSFNWDPNIRGSTTLLSGAIHPGYPRYTDLILNNPEFSKDVALSVYLRVGLMSYGIKSVDFLEQRDSLPEQNGPNGRALWMVDSDVNKLPAVSPTTEEAAEFARLMTSIDTYVKEMTVKFIMGAEPINDAKWNEFVQTQKRMGIDRITEIMQAQLERYNRR